MRDDMKAGDAVLFYHSSTKPMAVVGTATIVREGYPDDTAWDPESDHPDPKSTPEKPIWFMVDIKAEAELARPVTLEEIKHTPGSLEEALRALERDHDYLLKGDVFTEDVIRYWIKYKMDNEVDALRTRPHPYEFCLYFDI